MSTVRTRIHGVPVVATQVIDLHPNETRRLLYGPVPMRWEVQIAPQVPWPLKPFDLRSTYVGPQLTVLLGIAQGVVDEFLDMLDGDTWAEWCMLHDAQDAIDRPA
jgi:hypothetical protein